MLDIFCLTDKDGNLLPPAVQATILAKYSRSAESARQLVKEISSEEADKFQDKWVVQYGHNSVAELATIPICFEGVSIVASKFLESWPRAGYSEKSTRYQEFSPDSFVSPPGGSNTMKNFASKYYRAYQQMLEPMNRICAIKMNKDPDDPATKKDRTVRARAFDNIRYMLPAGTGTNLAAVINMLDARHMIKGLRGHPNLEFQAIGEQVYNAVIQVAPTLVKHTEPDQFTLRTRSLGNIGLEYFDFHNPKPYVRFSDYDQSHLNRNSDSSTTIKFKAKVADLYGMNWPTFCKHMETRPSHSEVPQVFRTVDMTFDIMMDYGAYRDLQRHRRCEQFSENLSPGYGYVIPDDIIGTELEELYCNTMNLIHSYEDEDVIHDPILIQYMVPLGYLHRTEFKMDMAELYYITELRTKPQGHISYRRIAFDMFDIASKRWPELLQWCRAIRPDSIGVHT